MSFSIHLTAFLTKELHKYHELLTLVQLQRYSLPPPPIFYFDNRYKCLLEFNSIGLYIAFCSQSCFVMYKITIDLVFNSKYPLISNRYLIFWLLNNFLCFVLVQCQHFLRYGFLPLWFFQCFLN